MVDGNLDRLEVPRADDADVRRLVLIVQRSNHDRRSDAEPIPRQIQRAVAFDEREQMAAAQPRSWSSMARSKMVSPPCSAVLRVRNCRRSASSSASAADSNSSQR